jgi:oxygen-independent coproporphyrinogen-3 oxidase
LRGIYIHIPFCKRLCAYCDFYSSISPEGKSELLQALLHEMELRRHYFPASAQDPDPATLYFGGGTPSVLAPQEIALLLQKAQAVFGAGGFAETTLEANPDDLSPSYLEALRAIGINRLSIGVQSFNAAHLQWMRRRHTATQAAESVKRARAAGFANLTIDLMYGFPALRTEEWARTLGQALALDVPHISAYHLTIEPRTLLGRQAEKGLLQPLDEEEGERQFLLLHHTLTQAGYVHYEVSNFARPGYEALHNSAYWQQQPYIGIGPSAHSFDGASRQWNVANNRQYVTALAQGRPAFERETLTLTMRYNEYILTGLRTAGGVNPDYIRQQFGDNCAGYFAQQAKPYLQTGKLVQQPDGRTCIPPPHFFVSDGIIGSLFLTTD